MGFVYTPPSDSTIQERKATGRDFDNILKPDYKKMNMKVKARPEEYKFRFLPATWNGSPQYANVPLAWAIKIGVHFNIGIDRASYLCNLSLNHSPVCGLCEIHSKLARDGKKLEADAIRASSRAVAWVIDREHEEKGPQLFMFPASLEQTIWNICKDKETGRMRYIDDPINGHTVFLTRVGDDEKTKWLPEIAPSVTPLSNNPEQMAKWLQFVTDNPLPGILQFYPDGYIQEVFSGTRKQGTLSQYLQNTEQNSTETRPEVAATYVQAPQQSQQPLETGFRRPMR